MSERRSMLRKMINSVVSRAQGTRPHQVRLTYGQQKGGHNDIINLPELEIESAQDLDPTSDTFGQFKFMLDYDDWS